MSSRLAAFVIWALVAGTAVFWGIRFFVHAAPAPMQVATADVGSLMRGDLSRLLGADPVAQAPVQSPGMVQQLGGRLRLTGVAAPKQHGGAGLAVISVDGNPPRVYRVGALIDSNLVLHDVSMRTATHAEVTESFFRDWGAKVKREGMVRLVPTLTAIPCRMNGPDLLQLPKLSGTGPG